MKLKIMIAAALAGGMALAGTPSHAAAIVAGPGAFAAGYPQPVAVTRAGTEVTFVNLDPLAEHNVVSVEKKLVNGKLVPLFQSAMVAAGETAAVTGTATIAPGTYNFFCAPHPGSMKGQLIVQ